MEGTIYSGLEPVLTPEEISARIADLSAEICRDLGGSVPVVVGILKGAFIFMSDLVRAMDIHVEVDFASISSYGDETRSSGRIKVLQDITTPVAGRDVIVVEDIIDTGLTLKHYMDLLKARSPASIRLCCLINKTERQEFAHMIDHLGFTVPEGFLVGYGLDQGGRYRNLPGVYRLINT